MEIEKLEYNEHSLDSLPLTLMMERSSETLDENLESPKATTPAHWPSTPDPFEALEEFGPDEAGHVPAVLIDVPPFCEKIELPYDPQHFLPNLRSFQVSDLTVAVPVAVRPWPKWSSLDLPSLPVVASRSHKEPGMGHVAWTKEVEMLLEYFEVHKKGTCCANLIKDIIHHNI